MILNAFKAKARAAETARHRDLWLARETAILTAYAVHSPKKMPSFDDLKDGLRGDQPKGQTGDSRRSLMKALALKSGGKITRRR